jgi:putative SOS response-associated peptidase YedK
MSSSRTEVADFFSAIVEDMSVGPAGNAPEEVYPGYPGMVLAAGGLTQMVWGFPLQRKGAKGQPLKPKPVNNARTDKLSGPFWSASFRQRRCLIPVTAFAEAEGPKGAKTRTWFSLPGQDLFAIGGMWRETAEWGPSYTMAITDACPHVVGVHDRMPVILARKDWPAWLDGSPEDAFTLCRPWSGDMTVERTEVPWAGRR